MAAVLRSEQFRRWSVTGLQNLATAIAYFGVAWAGRLKQLDIEGATVNILWPTLGVALSCMLIFGIRVWPGVALGAYVVVMLSPLRHYEGLVVAGNTLGAVCSCLLLRWAKFRLALDRLRDGLALVLLGGFGGMVISATATTVAQRLNHRFDADSFLSVWTAWWTGDALGVLVVTPLLLLLRRMRIPRVSVWRWAEATALALATVAVAVVVTRSELTLLFLVFPLLIWAALRFQLAGTAPCALVVTALATAAASDGVGPFHGNSVIERMAVVQAYNGATVLTGLLLAALVTEQLNIRRRIEEVFMELADVVDHLAPGTTVSRWPLRDRRNRAGGDTEASGRRPVSRPPP